MKSSLLAVACLLLSFPGFADQTEEIYALIEQDRLSDAMQQTETLLRDAPGNPAFLFAQAVISEKNGESQEAIKIYQGLTLSHPELLEPFNNLAIHYARAGDFKAAIATLEQAMQAHPSIATAYRNLTAIYAQLASAAYRKALDSNTPLEPLELASLDKLDLSKPESIQNPPILVASVENYISESLGQNSTTADSQPLPESDSKTTGESTLEQIEPAPEATSESTPAPEAEQPVVAEPVPNIVEKPKPEKILTTPEPAPEPEPVVIAAVTPTAEAKQVAEDVAAEKQALIDHIKSWAKAWSDRDVDKYLSHYSDSFKPRDNLTLEEWKTQRHGRLRWREFIIVKPSQYNISIDGGQASVDFSQYYKSERFEDTIRKTLKFRKEGDRWLIIRELI